MGYSDTSGLVCDGTESVYCNCNPVQERICKMKSKMSNGNIKYKETCRTETRYDCFVSSATQCDFGCKYGNCRSPSEACGTSWDLPPSTPTCSDLYSEGFELDRCEKFLGTSAVCPTSTRNGWGDVAISASKTEIKLRNAVADTLWWEQKIDSMVNVTGPNGTVPTALTGATFVAKYLAPIRDFSCTRNVP